MTIYVDELHTYRPVAGHTRWCHMATDGDLSELHGMAGGIGMRREWFQDKPSLAHYDLTPSRRALAIKCGAIEVDSMELMRRCSPTFRRVVGEGPP